MRLKLYPIYYIQIVCFLFLILFGLCQDTPYDIIIGLKNIIVQSDILITDYISVGGIGAAFVNAGLLGLFSIILLIANKIKPIGSTIMSTWLMAGFGLFGKNIFNSLPVIIGVWLYSKYRKEPFINYILVALLGTTLSPTVSQFRFTGRFAILEGVLFGVSLGITLGFILPPLASFCLKLHQGYNLYNVGFAGGLLATMIMSILRAFGINFDKRFILSSGNNTNFAIMLFILFTGIVIAGFVMNKNSFNGLKNLTRSHGRAVSDFYIMYGNSTFINMGMLGMIFTAYILIIGGELNGPTIGAIFTIVGFGAFGKNIRNVLPVLIGAIISGSFNIWGINSLEMILACLFSTTLAPISGRFGWPYGVLAGFLHVCVVMNTGYLHGGLNLYNNGLAGGIVAIILVPIIDAFKTEKALERA